MNIINDKNDINKEDIKEKKDNKKNNDNNDNNDKNLDKKYSYKALKNDTKNEIISSEINFMINKNNINQNENNIGSSSKKNNSNNLIEEKIYHIVNDNNIYDNDIYPNQINNDIFLDAINHKIDKNIMDNINDIRFKINSNSDIKTKYKKNIIKPRNKHVQRKQLNLDLNTSTKKNNLSDDNPKIINNIIYNVNNNSNINNIINNNIIDKNNIINHEGPNIPLNNIDLKNPETKIQFTNHNISNYNMLKDINFFERLKSISEERYSSFIEDYQKDNFFMEKEQFENIFIDEKNINIKYPLTLIFHYIFNPKTILTESSKNFFETIFTKRGDQDYSMTYDENDLIDIPKYFNDFNYVNNLFNNFNKNDLNLFLDEIKTWKKIFIFDQKFKYTIKHFIRVKNMNMHDVARVYFISPLDLIVDYHSYGSNFPMADVFIAITQYRFHCDINFNKKKGKFEFITSCTIYNTIKLVKKTLLEKTIIKESYSTNKTEIQINIWPNIKTVIENEDKKNQEIANKIFEKHLKNNLNKYSKEKVDEFDSFFDIEQSQKDIKNLCDKNNNEFNLNNNNINNLNNINIEETKQKSNNFNEGNEDIDNNINNYFCWEYRIKKEKKYKDNYKIKNSKKSSKNKKVLKYGVFFIFLLFNIKIILRIIRENFSFESLFYILLIIAIGIILIKLQIIHKK